jgi:hypothetical protein
MGVPDRVLSGHVFMIRPLSGCSISGCHDFHTRWSGASRYLRMPVVVCVDYSAVKRYRVSEVTQSVPWHCTGSYHRLW